MSQLKDKKEVFFEFYSIDLFDGKHLTNWIESTNQKHKKDYFSSIKAKLCKNKNIPRFL